MMLAPPLPLRAWMDRRLLVNYRVDPDVLACILPAPFRPAMVDGHGMAGICLLRLRALRPARLPTWLPAAVGLASENAAHRVAVCWDGPNGPVTGVYVPRRDTASRIAALAGGRLFPGWQHLVRFQVHEDEGRYRIKVKSRDGAVRIAVCAHLADSVMPGSVFAGLEQASRFFRRAPIGYAATPTPGVFDGVHLATGGWELRPLQVEWASSSFFDDPGRFPPGSAILDSAFLMGGLTTAWHPQPTLHAVPPATLALASRTATPRPAVGGEGGRADGSRLDPGRPVCRNLSGWVGRWRGGGVLQPSHHHRRRADRWRARRRCRPGRWPAQRGHAGRAVHHAGLGVDRARPTRPCDPGRGHNDGHRRAGDPGSLVGYLLGAAADPQGWLLVYLPVGLGALVAAALSRRLPLGRAGNHEPAGNVGASQRRPWHC